MANDRQSLRIQGERIFSVQTCRLHYTTYDTQRESDTINPTYCADVMVRAPDEQESAEDQGTSTCEPYWYARVLGIYHANVSTSHPEAPNGRQVRRMDFLWVRWFGAEPRYAHGFGQARLPKIGFVPSDDKYAFGFLDPAQVIRCCHLIPAFNAGRTSDLLPCKQSDARRTQGTKGDQDDWINYYVGM